VKLIYSYLDELKILHPYSDESNIGGFHYGLPFFTKRKIKSKIITKYNWYFDLMLCQKYLGKIEEETHHY